MSELDPYRDWLGIKSTHRPPNHYELLDLKLYESDRERIENSEMIEMAKVLRHENGPHAPLAARLCRELEEAIRCLLDPVDKAAYDAELFMTPHPSAPAADLVQVQTVEPPSRTSGLEFDFSIDLNLTDDPAKIETRSSSDELPSASSEEPEPHHVARLQTPQEQEMQAEEQAAKKRSRQERPKSEKTTPAPKAAAVGPPKKKPKAKAGGPQFSLPEISAKTLAIGVGIAVSLALVVGIGMLIATLPPGKSTVLAMIDDADPEVRIRGLYALQQVDIEHTEAASLLLKVLREEKVDDVRIAAVNTLINNGVGPSQTAEIKPLLGQEQNPTVKALLQWLVPTP